MTKIIERQEVIVLMTAETIQQVASLCKRLGCDTSGLIDRLVNNEYVEVFSTPNPDLTVGEALEVATARGDEVMP